MAISVLDFGAVSGGEVLCTAALQNAIEACALSGGGRVLVPTGKYKIGTVWLKSNVELHLEMGAELIASENMDDYNAVTALSEIRET